MSGTSPKAAAVVDRSQQALTALVLLTAEAGACALFAPIALRLVPTGIRERVARWLRVG
jgi:hypothetical protein